MAAGAAAIDRVNLLINSGITRPRPSWELLATATRPARSRAVHLEVEEPHV